MKTELSIVQRFLSDTPIFFKKLRFFGLALGAIAGALAGYSIIPVNVVTILATVAGTLVIFSDLAVKDAPIIAQAIESPAILVAQAPALIQDGEAVINSIKTQSPPPPVSDVSSSLTAILGGKTNTQPVDNPPAA